jgi:hypothetical protein
LANVKKDRCFRGPGRSGKGFAKGKSAEKRNSPVNILVLIAAQLVIGQVIRFALSLIKDSSRKAVEKVSRQLFRLLQVRQHQLFVLRSPLVRFVWQKLNLNTWWKWVDALGDSGSVDGDAAVLPVGSVAPVPQTHGSGLSSGDQQVINRIGLSTAGIEAMSSEWNIPDVVQISLSDALENNPDRACADVLDSTVLDSTSTLSLTDKARCGAVDSACNRTCDGFSWYNDFRAVLSNTAVEHLIQVKDEHEAFGFGNRGKLISTFRVRLPVCIFGHVVLVWISIIPCESSGLLLGKDFCEAIGGVIDFRRKQMKLSVLSNKCIPRSSFVLVNFVLI